MPSQADAQPNVLLACSDSSGGPAALKTALDATGLLGTVDIVDTSSTTPTVATLQGYDCVLVYSNNIPLSAATMGSNLAAYCDAGGGVVEMSGTSLTTYGLTGNWTTHTCIAISANWSSHNNPTIGAVVEAHPVITNVNDFTGGFARVLDGTVNNGARIL
ncbi:MAG: hypothetical protein AB7S36_15355, partial [Planctomycetota bacterium]